MRDVHAESGGVRRHSFVESERGGVTGTGDRAQEPRAQGTAPTGDVVGFAQKVNEGVDQTGSTETSGENTSGDDDAQDVAVAVTQAVKERLGEFLRVRARDEQADDGTEHHSLGHAHLDLRNNGVAQNQDDDRKKRHQSENNVRARDFFLLVVNLHLDVVRGFALILKEDAHQEDTDDAHAPEHHTVGGVKGDQVHDFHVGDLGDVGVVSGARREHAAGGTHHDSGSGHGGTDTSAKHHRNERGAHGSSAARSRGNGHVNHHGNSRADRHEENAQAADRLREQMHQVLVALRVTGNICKT